MSKKMNVLMVIVDTLRKDHLGCYGNKWIKTPSFDYLANKSVLFTNAYPDSLPTLQVRRALHTGCRVFPFKDHKDFKGNQFVPILGWGPIPDEQDTLAEILQRHGYRTAFFTDTYHQFKPNMNFHRGFDEWHWIRGQENDAFRSGPKPSQEEIRKHIPGNFLDQGMENIRFRTLNGGQTRKRYTDFISEYLMNTRERHVEEDYFPAQIFMSAADWLERNQDAEGFFLLVDSFDPHEPWDPPYAYRKLYDPEDENVTDILASLYGPADQINNRALIRLKANYAGEVTLVDRWLGFLLKKMNYLGLMENTIIVVVSDHGHSIGEHNMVAKTGYPMTREIADLVLMIYHPRYEGEIKCDALVYNFDIPFTILNLLDIEPDLPMDGKDIWSVALGKAPQLYDHVTCGWGPLVMVRDNQWWYNDYIWGEKPLLFNLESDPRLENNVAIKHPDICEKLRNLAVADAGGSVPDYMKQATDAPGCTPLL